MRIFILSVLLLTGVVVTSCGGNGGEKETLVAKGGKLYGGEFKFMSTEKINSLCPTSSADLYSMRLVSQIFEPLLKIDPSTSEVVHAVAEKHTVSDDATVYTFNIRKGIMFHEDDCFGGKEHELTAEDVKFSLDLACSGLDLNNVGYLLTDRIKGGQEFAEKTKKSFAEGGVSGIKVKDDYTLEITLNQPSAGFESILTHSGLGVQPKEAYDKYGKDLGKHPVGTGPFQLSDYSDEKITLERNPNYWQKDEFGNQLPFLDKVEMTYAKDKRSEFMAFRNKEIDLVLEIPVDEIEHILGTLKEAQEGKNVRHKVDSERSLSMMYIAMDNNSEEFSDVRVRRAFNMAINRDSIVEQNLEGEGWPAANGFVPDMANYPNEKVKGHSYNVAKAKSLMAEAGYANGKGFPALEMYVNAIEGSAVHKACEAAANQISENLGVDLSIKLVDLDQREAAIQSGEAKIWREGWIADYPEADNFLMMFYGGNIKENSSMVNTFKFRNEAYDKLFDKAQRELDDEKRTALLVKCDQMVIDEAPVIPVLTDDHIVMINARIKNFDASPLETINLAGVFIKEPKEKKETEE
jgi:peptide/nickel transport system substrate-binding protein